MKNSDYVTQVNSVIKEWKTAYAQRLAYVFPIKNIKADELSKKSWSDIISTAYDFISEQGRDRAENNPIYNACTANAIMFTAMAQNGLRGFDRDKNVHNFYRYTFGSALNITRNLTKDIFDAPDMLKEKYNILLPAGKKYNAGLPLGIKTVTPAFVEVFAVSENPDAAALNDVLVLNAAFTAASLKLVPELPKDILDWAEKNNLQVNAR